MSDEDLLIDKSEFEIRRAAAWWFLAQTCYLQGEYVPPNVFSLSTKPLMNSDVEWANNIIKSMSRSVNFINTPP